jgi:protein-S-isoprenylcysteine O-methyltransferase Ste14
MAAGWLLIGLAAAAFGRGTGQLASGVYRFSRNPMYVGYFLYFAGVGLATASWLYLLLALIEQIALGWIIRSEERWCLAQYGEPYRRYMQSVGRYLGGGQRQF